MVCPLAEACWHGQGDLYLVQRALGHRHITTTEIYARVGEERPRRAMGRSDVLRRPKDYATEITMQRE